MMLQLQFNSRVALSSCNRRAIDTLDWNAFQKLPFTTKNDLREAGHNMAAAPLGKAWIYYETTGTTGAATPCPRNEQDSIFNNTPLILRYRELFRAHGQQHIVGVMGPTELHSTGDTFEDVCRRLGHTVVKMWPRSPVVGLDRAVTPVMRGMAAARCSRRLKTQKQAGDLIVFDRFAAFKIGGG